jgi:PAT family beta-lactamase induction signal transducer AmpG
MSVISSTVESRSAAGRGPWWWVPSLYGAQALPYVLVNIVITYPYTRLDVSDIIIGYTGWLAIPWTIKPLWSPLVELIGTERRWIWITEYLAGAAILALALAYTSDHFLLWTILTYSLIGIISATHDIAADGFYMRVLAPHDQTWFSGIRSFAFRGGWVYCDGLLTILAGLMIRWKFGPAIAWSIAHVAAAVTMILLATYHALMLPTLAEHPQDLGARSGGTWKETVEMFRKFLAHIPLATALPFLLFYRFAEGQVVKFVGKFLLDAREKGGMGLVEDQLGVINGTLGILALLGGGTLAGMLASRGGVRKWLLPLAFMMNMTNLTFLALANF